MIQLSTFTANGLETPGKTAGQAAPDGLFASLLDLGLGEAAMPGGKILPEGGKVLPDGLPSDPPGLSLSALAAKIVAVEPAAAPEPKAAVALPQTEVQLAPAKSRLTDFAEPVGAERVEPVSVEPVEVTAAELADTVQADIAIAVLPVAVAALPAALPQDKTSVPAEAKAAPADSLPAPSQDKPAPERQPAQQDRAAAALAQPPRIFLPLAVPAVSAKTAEAPVDGAPNTVREPAQASAASTRVQPVAELKLALSADRQPAGSGDLPAARAAAPVQVLPAFDAPAMAPIAADAPSAVTNAKADFAPAAIQPHDLTTLVDRLIEARENARTAAGAVTVMHAEFGEVSLRFGHDNGNLTVSLANNDPGFVRAVNAAVAADGHATGNEAGFQGERRDGGQNGSARTAADSQLSSNDRGSGRDRDGRDGRSDRAEPQPEARGRGARRAHGGIFA